LDSALKYCISVVVSCREMCKNIDLDTFSGAVQEFLLQKSRHFPSW